MDSKFAYVKAVSHANVEYTESEKFSVVYLDEGDPLNIHVNLVKTENMYSC